MIVFDGDAVSFPNMDSIADGFIIETISMHGVVLYLATYGIAEVDAEVAVVDDVISDGNIPAGKHFYSGDITYALVAAVDDVKSINGNMSFGHSDDFNFSAAIEYHFALSQQRYRFINIDGFFLIVSGPDNECIAILTMLNRFSNVS